MKVAIIGGGAAGFFAAIQVKTNYPKAAVTLLEKSKKCLAKVKVSGGGRCNVTNGCSTIRELVVGYPRGGRVLKKLFRAFDNYSTQQWFTDRGVALKTEPDNRVFPVSNQSQSIIDCLWKEVQRLGISVELGKGVKNIRELNDGALQLIIKGEAAPRIFDKVIVATGGSPKLSGFDWLADLGHHIEPPVPSLFTFNMPNETIPELMGVVAKNVLVHIQGTKLKTQGDLLVTHWGMSGPAILKLSALGARVLAEMQYHFKVQINWAAVSNQELLREELNDLATQHAKKQLRNVRPYQLPERLWLFLLQKGGLNERKPWGELGKKGINKLVQLLGNDVYMVQGKTTFKEEFVTCGGISWESVDAKSLQSKVCQNLYFAGEVLDVDGITGGYNFQAAWTTGFVVGKLG